MKHLGRLIRSASLSGYVDLVKSLGRDPSAFMRTVGLSAKLLDDPETLIPGDAVRELLEITARATRTEDFALRLAAQRRLSNLGPISLVLKEEPTPRDALDTLCRYLKLVSASQITRIEDTGNGRRQADQGPAGITGLPAFAAAQTFPLTFVSPLARLSVRLHEKLRWNIGYQFYDYNENLPSQYFLRQFYRAHTGYASLTWSF